MGGKNHWNWKGGISKDNRGKDGAYLWWRREILSRDNYICAACGVRGGKLVAHHLFGWTEYPEYKYDLDNGVTLCSDYHLYLHGLGDYVENHINWET